MILTLIGLELRLCLFFLSSFSLSWEQGWGVRQEQRLVPLVCDQLQGQTYRHLSVRYLPGEYVQYIHLDKLMLFGMLWCYLFWNANFNFLHENHEHIHKSICIAVIGDHQIFACLLKRFEDKINRIALLRTQKTIIIHFYRCLIVICTCIA